MPEHRLPLETLLAEIKRGKFFFLMEPIFDQNQNLLLGTEKVLTEKDLSKVKERAPERMERMFHVRTVVPHYINEDKRIQWSAYLISLFEGSSLFKNMPRNQKDFVEKYLKNSLIENDYVIWKLSQVKNYSKKLFTHSINTAFIALSLYYTYNNMFFQGMIDASMVIRVMNAGFLHDIGLTKMDARFTEAKQIELKESERQKYIDHVVHGIQIIQSEADKHEIDTEVMEALVNHEERCDGSGGPRRRTNESLSFLSKIIALSCFFDWMISGEYSFKPRSYREYITRLRADKGKFDEKLVEALDLCFKHLFAQ